jgi:hypothetical protein
MSLKELQRQRIAPDGSCLFASIHFLSQNGVLDPEAPRELREHCAQTILSDQERYNELYLGKPPAEYAEWIREQLNYGGEVEILILADFLQLKICVVSIESQTILSYAPEAIVDTNKRKRKIFILYNGQHYDAIVGPGGECQFDDLDGEAAQHIDTLAVSLATEEKRRRDVELRTRQRKKIRCSCGVVLENADAFRIHAEEVDHGDEWGYECEDILVEETVANPTDD